METELLADFEIRDASLSDIPSILAIVNNAIISTTALYDYNPRSIEYQTDWFHNKLKDKKPVIVATLKDHAIAFGTFGIFRPWDAYQFSVEHSIYVSEIFRSKGIGNYF